MEWLAVNDGRSNTRRRHVIDHGDQWLLSKAALNAYAKAEEARLARRAERAHTGTIGATDRLNGDSLSAGFGACAALC
jgi:hypothetical protein